jgi:hypothetical protein
MKVIGLYRTLSGEQHVLGCECPDCCKWSNHHIDCCTCIDKKKKDEFTKSRRESGPSEVSR